MSGPDPKATLPSLRRAQRADLREGIRFPNLRRGLPHSPQGLHLICESSGPFFKQSKKRQTSRATGHLFLLFFFLFSLFHFRDPEKDRNGSNPEVQREPQNVRCRGSSGSQFRATGCLLVAKRRHWRFIQRNRSVAHRDAGRLPPPLM